jgi:endo-1,4-beta-xylanase
MHIVYTQMIIANAVRSHHPPLGLHEAIVARGKQWFGTSYENGTFRDDPNERRILDDVSEIGSITSENVMKWRFTQATQGNFTFDAADALVKRVESNGQQLHCHTLVWHFRLPPWVSEGNFDNKTLIDIMTTHIKTVVGRYKGKCTRWDVVNEGKSEIKP